MDRERRVIACFDRDEVRSHQADTAVDQPSRSVVRDARDAVGERRGSLCPTGRPIGEEQHALGHRPGGGLPPAPRDRSSAGRARRRRTRRRPTCRAARDRSSRRRPRSGSAGRRGCPVCVLMRDDREVGDVTAPHVRRAFDRDDQDRPDRSASRHGWESVTSIIRVMMCANLVDAAARSGPRNGIEGDIVEPNEIFELIIKADERIKYAKPGKGDLRAGQARELLETGARCGTRDRQRRARQAGGEATRRSGRARGGERSGLARSERPQPIRPPQSKFSQ